MTTRPERAPHEPQLSLVRMPADRSPHTAAASTRPLRGPGGIFWRTFFLIALLIGASLAAWFQSFRVLERDPRAQQIAQALVSMVNVTRAALIHSDPAKRRDLLIELASNEGLRLYPQEESDRVEPLPDGPDLAAVQAWVRSKLGPETVLSLQVNGQEGFWISFGIDGDNYWAAFDRERLDRVGNLRWLGWGAIALGFSMLGAILISRLINLPLQRLTAATVTLGQGVRPPPLPERGPREIRAANASFNAMVADLERIESDRALLLAGISHDLRTPLTRLRLEVEMSAPDEATRAAMSHDIDQMDAVIGQFLDYARPPREQRFMPLDLAELVRDLYPDGSTSGVQLTVQLGATQPVAGDATDLKRIIENLVENARRYARRDDQTLPQVRISVQARGNDSVVLAVEDDGPGVPADALERLKRPFTRLDTARGQANGAGLGLAIVERIAQRHGARFELSSTPGQGLTARLIFPAAAQP